MEMSWQGPVCGNSAKSGRRSSGRICSASFEMCTRFRTCFLPIYEHRLCIRISRQRSNACNLQRTIFVISQLSSSCSLAAVASSRPWPPPTRRLPSILSHRLYESRPGPNTSIPIHRIARSASSSFLIKIHQGGAHSSESRQATRTTTGVLPEQGEAGS